MPSARSKKTTTVKEPTESRDLLPILNQLHPDAFPDGAVRLLGLDADFLQHDALCVRGAAEGRGFVGRAEEALLVVQVGPAALAAMGAELAGGVETTGFSFTHDCWRGVLANGLGGLMSFFRRGVGNGKA